MDIKTLNIAVASLQQGYHNEIKNALVDDFNSESASIIICFKQNVNLKSLNAKIKRFFKYYMNQNVYPNEFMREGDYYMFDVHYAYSTGNEDYLSAFNNNKESSFIKAVLREKRKQSQ